MCVGSSRKLSIVLACVAALRKCLHFNDRDFAKRERHNGERLIILMRPEKFPVKC